MIAGVTSFLFEAAWEVPGIIDKPMVQVNKSASIERFSMPCLYLRLLKRVD
jgi:hypothetical protein